MPNSATAVVDNSYGSALVTIDFSSSPAATGLGATVCLTRNYPDGTTAAVRGSCALLAAGMAVFGDTELPLGTPIFYTATCPQVAGVTLTSNTVTVTGNGASVGGFLKDPVNSSFDFPLVNLVPLRTGCEATTGVGISSWDTEAFDPTSGIFPTVGDARPRVIAQVRHDATGQLTLVTTQYTDYTLLKNILASGRTLLLQVYPGTALGWGISSFGSDYIAVGSVLSARMPSQDMRHSQREWQLPITLVSAPSGIANLYGGNNVGVRGATWRDLKVSGLTWRQLAGTDVSDTFNRTVASGWGSDDFGDAYTNTGTASDYNVSGGFGTHLHSVANTVHESVLATTTQDADGYVTLTWNGLAVGASMQSDVRLRRADANNFYGFRAQIETSAAVTAVIYKTVGGSTTVLVSGTVSGLTFAANTLLRMRTYVKGTTLQIKIWAFGTPEPTAWTLTTTDAALSGNAGASLRTLVNTGGTVPRTASFTRWNVNDLQTGETWLQVAQGVGF